MSRTKLRVVLAVAVAALAGSPGHAEHRVLRGYAHYYSDSLIGNTMACGGAYRPWKMIAAHRTLDCGKRVRVRNVRNGKVVELRIKDRGPFGDDDVIIDVSRKAAKRLGFLDDGTTRVRVRVLHRKQ